MMGEESIRFRPVRREDLPVLRAIAAATWDGEDYLAAVAENWIADDGYFAGILLDGRLVGCGRVLPLAPEIAWLEALRIEPEARGRGLGRRMSAHLLAHCLERGYRRLLFSTYFRNEETIRITEPVGFRRIGVYTNLENREPAAGMRSRGPVPEVVAEDGLPEIDAILGNDWLFVPPEAQRRDRFFPRAVTLRSGPVRMVVCDNLKLPRTVLEIAWFEGDDRVAIGACLREALRRADREGRDRVHLMAPAGTELGPFRALGFDPFEKSEDVFLYEGLADPRTRGSTSLRPPRP
ncbi:MAG: GNAT family N-acetyltransferase [Candidatus Eisenbacteria bacterium]|nr:GNAT family N-acetyltransferase [Candidatus Latescibacterota bacterium]MBD3301947.1 GNAT family N-acetyltransferase [Candidatus Eisenbacteria bacterium]